MNSGFSTNKNYFLLGTDLLSSPLSKNPDIDSKHLNYMPFGFAPRANYLHVGFTGNLIERASPIFLLGNGYRAFASTLMRFIASDELSPFGAGGINSYAYCKAEPINSNDDNGKFSLFRIFSQANRVRINVSVVKKTFGKFERMAPNRWEPRYKTAQYFGHTEKLKKVKQGTLLVYKGKQITDRPEALNLMENAIRKNRRLINSHSANFNMSVVVRDTRTLVERHGTLSRQLAGEPHIGSDGLPNYSYATRREGLPLPSYDDLFPNWSNRGR